MVKKSRKQSRKRSHKKSYKKSYRIRHQKRHRRSHKKMYGRGFPETRQEMATLLANPEDRRSNMLNTICGPSSRGECVDFGFYKETINTFFNDFTINNANASMISSIKQIGSASSNGSIIEFKYTKNTFSAYAILKINQQSASDNLLYEYYVGKKFINEYIQIFPCFVETYGMYKIKNTANDFFDLVQNSPNKTITDPFDIPDATNLLELIPDSEIEDITQIGKKACLHGKQNDIGILIQHYDNFTSMRELFASEFPIDGYSILFQMYFVLKCLKNIYTHYDFHPQNAFAYKPYAGKKFVVMTYHMIDGTEITFPTEYIGKIIDYGRNHFNNVNISTRKVVENLCAVKTSPNYTTHECYDATNNSYCGDGFGMGSVMGEQNYNQNTGQMTTHPGNFYYIDPINRNMSHDLRCINELNKKFATSPFGNIKYSNRFGTPERIQFNFANVHSNSVTQADMAMEILNVSDMSDYLKLCLSSNSPQYPQTYTKIKFVEWSTGVPSQTSKYNKYGSSSGWVKMGDFHIYEDMRPYEFIPSHA